MSEKSYKSTTTNYLLVLFLLAGNLLSGTNSDSLTTKKKHITFLTYAEFAAGVNMNQGSIGYRYFQVNYTTTYRTNLNILVFRNFDLNCAANYLKKSMVGDLFNASRKDFFFGKTVDSDYYPDRPHYNFDIIYYSFDLSAKITFFRKKRLQPFVEFGLRENVLVNHKYNTSLHSVEIDEYIEPNLKRYFLNYTYLLGVSYRFPKLKSAILAEIEINNDRRYLTEWKYGRATYLPRFFEQFYGGKFQSMLFRIGYRYYL